MQVPLTDNEFIILDYLADGAQPLTWLVRELHGSKRSWDASVIVNSLVKLIDRQLIHYSQSPGGPNFTNPTPEVIHAQVIGVLDNNEQHWWIELTEAGQSTWETWQQTKFGS